MSQSKNRDQLITVVEPMSPMSEIYRNVLTNIEYSGIDVAMKCVGITSSVPAEGKSTTISNLAVAYAQNGKKTLLIDGDLRRPIQNKQFNCSRRRGITSYMTGQHMLDDAIQETDIPNLSLLTAGPQAPNPFEVISSKKMKDMIQELKSSYDMILVDMPPVLAVSDAQVMSSFCDGMLLIVRSGVVKRQEAAKAKEQLERAGAKLLGTVLNRISQKEQKMNYYYYYGERGE